LRRRRSHYALKHATLFRGQFHPRHFLDLHPALES
jgi:hypothetical protein